ncbi:asparagine synthase (glutamine-hydrolyzing) [Phytohabitans aurantiacus]|uniref:asparagine synthase (glutamine-hydrolyzing) n=1 Tax=Phytohabitans aurantiacus TaxID=3016789 RepID=A0ABQ5QW20_9ACTN|nr:asparagine synthase (glutamine-hydrolyzing) [Phytohabitans aurantiacus]GLH98480.1 asparagine synthetase B [Phytohabitans aurantiacus]
MCGIAGWVDFGHDVPDAQAVLDAMTDALASRGPDARGTWLGRYAALGHTRNSVIDLAGGIQPMLAREDGRILAVLTYSGEVYNFRSLRIELERRGHTFLTRSDTEVVLRSYLEWGADCARHLEGMFAFAVWDERRQELVLIRDRLGIKPLFYAVLPSGAVLFGSEPKALLAHPGVRPIVDADGLRELFSTAKTPGQAVFRDMRELLPGHTLTISRTGRTQCRYWTLEARPHTDDLATTTATVRSMLEEIVTRELVADVPLCTALSGGIDSSAVTALASIARRAAGDEPVRTITATFVGYSENFRPDDQRDTPDAPYAAELARHVGAEHTDIVLGTADLIDPAARRAALVAQDMPTTLGDMDTSLYLMLRATREHSTVALTGETADEIFGGFKWLHDAELVAADTFPWVAAEMRSPASRLGQGRALFDPGLMSKLDMTGYYRDSYRQALRETPHQEGESEHEHRMREQCYLQLVRWLPMLLDRGDRLAMASGLETRVPFCDHRLVEYVYNAPWSFKSFDGREKSLLRAAVKDLVPPSVLARPKSPYPVTQDPTYTQALHRELSDVLSNPDSPVLPFLHLESAQQAVAELSAGAHDWHARMNVEMACGFNTWLTEYNVEIAV